jgi:hypothetical protein
VERPDRFLLQTMMDPTYLGFFIEHVLNKTPHPLQVVIVQELWRRPFPLMVAARGAGKSFLLAVYFMAKAFLCQGIRIAITGAAFRQAKVVFEYCEEIWRNAPVLRDMCNSGDGPHRSPDEWTMRLGDSVIFALPIGDGKKIRGKRAGIVAADEFAAGRPDIYETVIAGFGSTATSPIENVKRLARQRARKRMGLIEGSDDAQAPVIGVQSNQSIIAGSAYYAFNHFCHYWKKWKAIVESRGDPKKLAALFPDGAPPGWSWKHYSVIRVPVWLLPEGYMDLGTLARSKTTVHSSIYLNEYEAVFSEDSDGFFKRSLVESCVVGKPGEAAIKQPSCGVVSFTAALKGGRHLGVRYVLGVDPASESDNFGVVVLELWPDHRRVVHCWTTTRKQHQSKTAKGLTKDNDFYAYVARKIRELKSLFSPCAVIALDKLGGGVSVLEALHGTQNLQEGETPIWERIVEDDPKESDSFPGEHLVELIYFSRADWVSEANHGLKKDLEDKALLFPELNPAVLGLAAEEDVAMGRVRLTDEGEEKLYDTLEDCALEIEELKDEMATIKHSQTSVSGRERWDTPETEEDGKKGRMRKDRYSALLMANAVARQIKFDQAGEPYPFTGGFAGQLASAKKKGTSLPGKKRHHQNPDWYERATAKNYGAIIRRS